MMTDKNNILLWMPFIITFFAILLILTLTTLNKVSITSNILVLLILLILLGVFPLSKIVEIPGIIKIRKEVRELRREVNDKFTNLQKLINNLKMSQHSFISISPQEGVKQYNIPLENELMNERDIKKRIDKIDKKLPARDEDPVIELFKIRYILEERIRHILAKRGIYNRKMTLYSMILEIKNRKIVKPEIADRIMYIANVSSGIIHGEKFNYDDIDAILKIGQSLLAYLDKLAENISAKSL